MVGRPNGIFIVTGPTGSGKTTTLYSALKEVNTEDVKILTAEDPVEYEVEGIMQVPINHQVGLTFAAALRSFLRQDPDTIMVGEIRDIETAQIAVQASLTGHVVLSTLHTNDAPGAVTRLIDMGLEPFLISASLEGVLAQRLLRRICKTCRTPYEPDKDVVNMLDVDALEIANKNVLLRQGLPRLQPLRIQGPPGPLRADDHQRPAPRPHHAEGADPGAQAEGHRVRHAPAPRRRPPLHLRRSHLDRRSPRVHLIFNNPSHLPCPTTSTPPSTATGPRPSAGSTPPTTRRPARSSWRKA
jgi:energy-coupling factor transporter ATP-binding protein EcfA2